MWVDALDEWNVTINDMPLNMQEKMVGCNGTHYFVYFTCTTSTIAVQIVGKYVRPHALGDINGDGVVDIYDAILLAGAYNSVPNDPNWNSSADINRDNIVDIYDAIILANNYGKTA
jgi:hypothetical protein